MRLFEVNEIEMVAKELSSGSIGAIPTETVYGLGGNAFKAEVVTKIFAAKKRPSFDPLIVHVSDACKSLAMLASLGTVNSQSLSTQTQHLIDALIEKFWPGPLTLVLPKGPNIPDIVTSGLSTVGVRCPNHPATLALLRLIPFPLAAPSANLFGKMSPTRAEHVTSEMKDVIPWVLDGGPCEVGVESTIVHVDDKHKTLRILRAGKITSNDLKGLLRLKGIAESWTIEESFQRIENVELKNSNSGTTISMNSPGQLPDHYAPNRPLFVTWQRSALPHLSDDTLASLNDKQKVTSSKTASKSHKKIALLELLSKPIEGDNVSLNPSDQLLEWSRSWSGFEYFSLGSLDAVSDQEVAHQMFETMRLLDSEKFESMIVFLPKVSSGLWPAIFDRLSRASQNKNPNHFSMSKFLEVYR
jgi:L-threonylcarbamoyladenylate synthase